MAALAQQQIVAVIGSGAMGAGIAQVAAAAGYTVKLYDTRPEAVGKAMADIGKVYDKLVEKGRMSAADAAAATARLRAAGSLADVAERRWWWKPSSKTSTSSAACSPSWRPWSPTTASWPPTPRRFR